MVATYAWGAGAGVIHSAAAKAGVLSMTRTLAVEWGSKYGLESMLSRLVQLKEQVEPIVYGNQRKLLNVL